MEQVLAAALHCTALNCTALHGEQALAASDPRSAAQLFAHCEDGTRTLYYHI
jgi:hypothetical protein